MPPPFDQIVEPVNSLSRNKYTVKDLRFRPHGRPGGRMCERHHTLAIGKVSYLETTINKQ